MEPLSTNAVIEIARIFIPPYLQEGLSVADILTRFRAEGYKIRTQTFYQLARQARTIKVLEPVWNTYDRSRALPNKFHALTDRNIPTKYQYLFDVDLEDVGTGKLTTTTIGVYSDAKLSIGEAARQAVERLQQETEKYQYLGYFVPEDVQPVFKGAYQRSAVSAANVGRS